MICQKNINISLYNFLPNEIINKILLLDKRFVLQNMKIILINKISKKDKRYTILKNKIYVFFENFVIKKTFANYVVIHNYNTSTFCSNNFYKYIYDSIKMFRYF